MLFLGLGLTFSHQTESVETARRGKRRDRAKDGERFSFAGYCLSLLCKIWIKWMKECECEVLIPASVICIFLKYLRERERDIRLIEREKGRWRADKILHTKIGKKKN